LLNQKLSHCSISAIKLKAGCFELNFPSIVWEIEQFF
jgi:hypothetical protein